jgi:hypothetical protein
MSANWIKDEQKPYRLGYPDQSDDETETDMLRFYKGEIPSKPHGDFIDNIHEKWFGDYAHLEIHHGYIQWIFPIREEGVNFSANRLQKHELLAIRADPVIRARVIRSYEMMLDFYGMVLVDRDTGEIARNQTTYKSRYAHLNSSFHNYLRISRILKSLGEFGFERFKVHWIEFFIDEIFVHGNLRNTLSSLQGFWVPTLRHRDERVACKNKIHGFLKQNDTDDEGDDMGDNPDMKDLPTPSMPRSGAVAAQSSAGSADTSDAEGSEEGDKALHHGESDDADDEFTDSKPGEDDSSTNTGSQGDRPLNEGHATSSTASMSESNSGSASPRAEPAPASSLTSTAPSAEVVTNDPPKATPSASNNDPDAVAASLASLSLGTDTLAGSSSNTGSDLSASEDLEPKLSTPKETSGPPVMLLKKQLTEHPVTQD